MLLICTVDALLPTVNINLQVKKTIKVAKVRGVFVLVTAGHRGTS